MMCVLYAGSIPRIVIKMFLIGHNGIFTPTLKDTSSVKLKCKNIILVLKWALEVQQIVGDCIFAAYNCGLKCVQLKCSVNPRFSSSIAKHSSSEQRIWCQEANWSSPGRLIATQVHCIKSSLKLKTTGLTAKNNPHSWVCRLKIVFTN